MEEVVRIDEWKPNEALTIVITIELTNGLYDITGGVFVRGQDGNPRFTKDLTSLSAVDMRRLEVALKSAFVEMNARNAMVGFLPPTTRREDPEARGKV